MEDIGFDILKHSIAILKGAWRVIIAVLSPVILIPLIYAWSGKEGRACYVFILMLIQWMLELLPLPVTAMLPIVFLPLFGVLATDSITRLYMKDTIMLYFGNLAIAVAFQQSNLHKRIALKILLNVAKSINLLMFGFMLSSTLLSMWLTNSTTAALMVSIATVLIKALEKSHMGNELEEHEGDLRFLDSSEVTDFDNADTDKTSTIPSQTGQDTEYSSSTSTRKKRRKSKKSKKTRSSPTTEIQVDSEEFAGVRNALYLSIAYSSTIGGSATLTGTGTNIVFKGILETLYPNSHDITFTTWLLYNLPIVIICEALAWGYLRLFIMQYKKEMDTDNDIIKRSIKLQYAQLGKITFHEVAVLCLFTLLVLIWIFREPGYFTGWMVLFDSKLSVENATPAIAVLILLFVVPAKPKDLDKSPTLVSWQQLKYNMSWDILILIGGGIAIAQSLKVSGLGTWFGNQLDFLKKLPVEIVVLIFSVLSTIFTEFFSNIVTANLILPIASDVSKSIKVNPLYLMIPVTTCCSFSFMLPTGTPPNALAFEASRMKLNKMVIPGIIISVLCCLTQFITLNTIGVVMFSLKNFPAWIMK